MGFTRLAVKLAVKLPEIEKFSRFLFIGPHPDDIEIGAGATAARFAAEGKQVCFLICTDGRFGSASFPAGTPVETVIETRKQETLRGAELLGVKDVRFLGLSDGGFYSREELLEGIAGVIADFRPDVVFCPDPNSRSESHRDHLNVGDVTRQAVCFAGFEGIMAGYGATAAPVSAIAYYMTADVNRTVKTTGYRPAQLRAIFEGHPSQYPAGSPDCDALKLYLKLRAAEYGLRYLGTGEGFRVQGPTHMHCLPEAR